MKLRNVGTGFLRLRVAELTPRLWKQHFASQPLRSDLHGAAA
jgi:hypothetical protein